MIQEELNIMLMCAVQHKIYDAVIEYVERGADINNAREGLLYALFAAFYNRDVKMIKILIENGADPMIINEHQETFISRVFLKSKLGSYIFKFRKSGDEIRNYVKSYDAQKIMITNYPKSLFELNRCEILHDDLKVEYNHLLSANELNLL